MNITFDGRLGNIFFQLAHKLSENKNNLFVFVYHKSGSEKYYKNICNNINKIGPKLKLFYCNRDYNFEGYFQSEKYFDSDYMHSIFYIHPKNIEYYRKNYFQIDFDNCVAIHVRRTDYTSLNSVWQIIPIEYYEQIYKKYFKEKQCIIFSDDIEWCKQNFNFKNQIFIHQDEFTDLILFSLCKNHICSPSTYAWFGCWLNEQKDSINIFPETWFKEGCELTHERKIIENNIIPERWIRSDINISSLTVKKYEIIEKNEIKKLILIGNKIINRNMSDLIDQNFDKVIRINRMNNFFYTGTKLDYLYICQNMDFFDNHKMGVFKDFYKKAERIYINKQLEKNNYKFTDFFTLDECKKFIPFDAAATAKNISYGKPWPTSTICFLDWIVHQEEFKDYEIWITCIDIEGRGKMFLQLSQWKRSVHRDIGIYEEEYLKRLILDGKIKVLKDE